MSLLKKSGNLDNSSTKVDAYWAKRMPRTAAKQPEAFRVKKKNYRETEKVVIRINGYDHKITLSPLDEYREVRLMETAPAVVDRKAQRQHLKELVASERRRRIMDIVITISYLSNIPVSVLVSANREREVTQARAVISRIARCLGYSYPQIAKVLGNKDHATIIYSVKSIKLRRETERLMVRAVKVLAVEANGDWYDNQEEA